MTGRRLAACIAAGAMLTSGCGSEDEPSAVEPPVAATETPTANGAATPSDPPSPTANGTSTAASTPAPVPVSATWGRPVVISPGGYMGAPDYVSAVSADGSRIAFSDGDNNGESEVWVYTVADGKNRIVSTSSKNRKAEYDLVADGDDHTTRARSGSFRPSLSADGRTIAFDSTAVNLVPGDTNRREDEGDGAGADTGQDIFVKDLRSGKVLRASTNAKGEQADGDSTDPSLSADGTKVAFVSTAANLVPDDTNGKADIFVKDLRTGGIVRLGADAAGKPLTSNSATPALSGNGNVVAFVLTSGASKYPGASPDRWVTGTVLVADLTGNRVVEASRAAADGSTGASDTPSLSADGRKVAFVSTGPLLAADQNKAADLYVRELRTDKLTKVSGVTGKKMSVPLGTISPDGKTVAYVSRFGNPFTEGDRSVDDVVVVTLSGGTQKVVATRTTARDLVASANGATVAFAKARQGGDEIGVVLVRKR